MPMPLGGIATTNVDAAADDPSAARVEILAAITQLNDLIASYGVASGYASLDAGALVPVAQLPAASLTASGISERATQAEVDAGTDVSRHVTPETMTGKIPLSQKVIDIGDWDMDTNASKSIATGVPFDNVRSVSALIRIDGDFDTRDLLSNGDGTIYFTGSSVSLNRVAAGSFDSTNYDSTSYNRGWVTIWYVG